MRHWHRSLAWAFTAAVIGPIVGSGIVCLAVAIVGSRSRDDFVGTMLGSFVLTASTQFVVGLAVLLPPYAVLLLIWPRLTRRWSSLETSRTHFVAAMAIAALPAAIGLAIATPDGPFAALVFTFLSTFAGLVISRITVPWLALGTFSSP
jgi:HAMP domain-containing protein